MRIRFLADIIFLVFLLGVGYCSIEGGVWGLMKRIEGEERDGRDIRVTLVKKRIIVCPLEPDICSEPNHVAPLVLPPCEYRKRWRVAACILSSPSQTL